MIRLSLLLALAGLLIVGGRGQAQTYAPTPAGRLAFASDFEARLLGTNVDATVRASGPGHRVLTITAPSVQPRPFAYQISADPEIVGQLRQLGFCRVAVYGLDPDAGAGYRISPCRAAP